MGGGGWRWVEVKMNWVKVKMRWVEVDGSGQSWVHGLVIPICEEKLESCDSEISNVKE